MKRITFLFLLALAVIFTGSCGKRSHEKEKKVKRTEPQVNAPDPSQDQKKESDARLEWNMATLVDAYEKIGVRDKKWDAPAKDALKFLAQARAYGPDIEGFPHWMVGFAGRARDLGCTDPMIQYIHTRWDTQTAGLSKEQIAQRYADASAALAQSQYTPMRKFFAAIRAEQMCAKVERNTTYWNMTGSLIAQAESHLLQIIEDKTIPPSEIDDACGEFIDRIRHYSNGKQMYDDIERVLLKNWSRHGFVYLQQGKFYVNYAWKARGNGYANTVKPEQWKLFFERLETAAQFLQKGAEVDPKDGRIPAEMITVVSAQQKDFAEMRRWFDKAMEAAPNNNTACQKLLYFLEPKWGGSREAMLEFARECVASEKWGGTVPLTLVDAHYNYNKGYGAKDGSYWKQPDVWSDLQSAYDKFFSLNPKAAYWRPYYARYAAWCGQWDAFLNLITDLDEKSNYDAFDGREQFDKFVEQAKQHVKSTKNSATENAEQKN